MESDNRKMVTLFFHFSVFSMYMYTLIYDSVYLLEAPHRTSYAGRFKFLTFWNELVQTVYFGYSVINDIYGINLLPLEYLKASKVPVLLRFRDFIAASIVFPASMFVAITFWTLYAIDRELVYPSSLDKIVPVWLNHMWHTNVLLFLVIERLFIYHKYPRRLCCLSTLLGFAVVYQLWMFWIAYYANLWVYPVLEVLGWPARILFLVMCWLLMFACYFAGEVLTIILWRAESPHVVATKAE